MAEIPKDLRFLLFGRGPKWHAQASLILECLAFACLIVGIIGDATNKTLGLEPINWFLMSIAFFVWGLAGWFCSYFGAKEG